MQSMTKKEKQKKLEYAQRIARATAPGTFPGQNRARKFVDRKHKSNKYACRKPVRWD